MAMGFSSEKDLEEKGEKNERGRKIIIIILKKRERERDTKKRRQKEMNPKN